jgi:hypothetical protein
LTLSKAPARLAPVMKNKSKLWFFTNSKELTIHTYEVDNRATEKHSFQSKENFEKAIESFLEDGHKFIEDQGI